jgi:hypothetical protein
MLFAILGLFMACEEEATCTADIKYSVQMSLEDQDGNPITDADISYIIDGVEGEFVEEMSGGTYAVGEEEAGEFEISIAVHLEYPNDECCWAEGAATISLTVEADECHVIPELIEPTLDWVDVCADSEDCG